MIRIILTPDGNLTRWTLTVNNTPVGVGHASDESKALNAACRTCENLQVPVRGLEHVHDTRVKGGLRRVYEAES